MVKRIPAADFVAQSRHIPVLDVRSPSEFEQGHLPGAISFPLFSDDERAEVGTLYKESGQAMAMAKGLEIVGPKIKAMYELGMGHARDGKILVYCWRGGKRSESVANLLAMNGLEVQVMEKGYKAFRQWVLSLFERRLAVRIVGGRTGSGKTKILRALRARGEQTIDLEALADHRGSAFGRLGLTRHVTQAQFENDLAVELSLADERRPLWLEDESRNIGRLILPEALWLQMRAAQVWYIDLPEAVRLRLLMDDYGHFGKEEIKASLDKIAERLGGLRYQQALEALDQHNGELVASMTLEYYDKTYGHGLGKRPPANILRRQFESFSEDEICDWMIKG